MAPIPVNSYYNAAYCEEYFSIQPKGFSDILEQKSRYPKCIIK